MAPQNLPVTPHEGFVRVRKTIFPMTARRSGHWFRISSCLGLLLTVNGAATGLAAVYVLAQNVVNYRVIARETPADRANRLWEDRPVLAEARTQVPDSEALLLVTAPRAAFRRYIAHYALYPRRVERLEVETLPGNAELERHAQERSVHWIVVDGKSGFGKQDEEDRVWRSSE